MNGRVRQWVGVVLATFSLLWAGTLFGQQSNIAARADQTAEIAVLKEQVQQLKADIARLRNENQFLRRAMAQQPAASTDQGREVQPSKPAGPPAQVSGRADQQETGYWMTTSSGKRHNKNCRYYKNSNGRFCRPDEGIPCKICGG